MASAPHQQDAYELVVVGAGLAALHLVSRLPDALLKGTVVVDSHGTWLGSWRDGLERLAAPHLRPPATQHPHPSPLELQAYAERTGRQSELVLVVKGAAPVPTLPLFLEFCRDSVVAKLPEALRAPLHDTVERVQPLLPPEGGDASSDSGSSNSGSGCRVHLASGRVLLARAVAYTAAPRQPLVPAWVRQAAAAPGGDGASPGAVPAALPPGFAIARSVDLRSFGPPTPAIASTPGPSSSAVPVSGGSGGGGGGGLAGTRVAVVGGGMSAVLLAAGAAERGATVTLLCRRPLKPQAFETEVGWWGSKELNAYRHLGSPPQRIAACQRARGQGSVHLPAWRRLVSQAVAGRLTVLEGWEVASAEREQQGGDADDEGSDSQVVWLLAVQPQRVAGGEAYGQQPTIFQQAVTAAAGGAPADTGTAGAGASASEAPSQAAQPPPQQQQMAADRVWLACGRAYSAQGDPVLRQLLQQRPTLLAGGYPWLDDGSLCWPGAAVYVLGRAALLGVGPCAGDLPGMRQAAERVLASLKRLDYSGADTAWRASRQRLLQQARDLVEAPPQGQGVLQHSSKGPGGQAVGDDDEIADEDTDDDGVDEDEDVAAAVARAAATAALVALPLEAEGRMWEEPRRKALVSRPDNVIDVSDLDPQLPRRELQRYQFSDDAFEICVVCQLGEAVTREQVRVLFGERSLEMWAVGQAAAYHLHLPRLYGRLIVHKCGVKVATKAAKVYLLLQKESDAEWRFLKG